MDKDENPNALSQKVVVLSEADMREEKRIEIDPSREMIIIIREDKHSVSE